MSCFDLWHTEQAVRRENELLLPSIAEILFELGRRRWFNGFRDGF